MPGPQGELSQHPASAFEVPHGSTQKPSHWEGAISWIFARWSAHSKNCRGQFKIEIILPSAPCLFLHFCMVPALYCDLGKFRWNLLLSQEDKFKEVWMGIYAAWRSHFQTKVVCSTISSSEQEQGDAFPVMPRKSMAAVARVKQLSQGKLTCYFFCKNHQDFLQRNSVFGEALRTLWKTCFAS